MCEAYRPNPILHPRKLRQRPFPPHLLRHSAGLNELAESIDHGIPELLVFGMEEQDQTRGLRVEGAGHVQDRFVDEFFDLGVWDWGGFAQGVDCASGAREVREGFGWGGHFGGWGCCEGA